MQRNLRPMLPSIGRLLLRDVCLHITHFSFYICTVNFAIVTSFVSVLFLAKIDDCWALEDKIDEVVLLTDLHYIIGIMGAFLLAERRMNFRKLHRGEMYQRKSDMFESLVIHYPYIYILYEFYCMFYLL